VNLSHYDGLYEAADSGVISERDWDDLWSVDVFATAQDGLGPDAAEVLITLELAVAVGEEEVRRAWRGADVLNRVGLRAVGAVNGRTVEPAARALAGGLGVEVLPCITVEECPLGVETIRSSEKCD
jgi:predicted RecB family endonuclease